MVTRKGTERKKVEKKIIDFLYAGTKTDFRASTKREWQAFLKEYEIKREDGQINPFEDEADCDWNAYYESSDSDSR